MAIKSLEKIENNIDGIVYVDYITLNRVYKYWNYNTNELILPRELLDMYLSERKNGKPTKVGSRVYDVFLLLMYNAYLQWFEINKFYYGVSYNKDYYKKLKSNIIFSDDVDLLLYKTSKLTYHKNNKRFKNMEYKYRYIAPYVEFMKKAHININAIEYGKEIKSIKVFDYFQIENHPKRKIKIIKYRFTDEIMDLLFLHPQNNVKFNFKEYITLGNKVSKHIYSLLFGKYIDRKRISIDVKKASKVFNVNIYAGKISYYFLINKIINGFQDIRKTLNRLIWGEFHKINRSNGKIEYLFEIEKLSENEKDKIEKYKNEHEKYILNELEKCNSVEND